MDFTTRKTRERIVPYEENDDWENVYTQNVTLYHIPPTEDISLQTFEELAIERLNVLRILDQAANKSLRIMSDEWRDTIIADLNQAGLKNYVRLIEGRADATARRRDYISHFILRLAYCRTQDLKRLYFVMNIVSSDYGAKFCLISPQMVSSTRNGSVQIEVSWAFTR